MAPFKQQALADKHALAVKNVRAKQHIITQRDEQQRTSMQHDKCRRTAARRLAAPSKQPAPLMSTLLPPRCVCDSSTPSRSATSAAALLHNAQRHLPTAARRRALSCCQLARASATPSRSLTNPLRCCTAPGGTVHAASTRWRALSCCPRRRKAARDHHAIMPLDEQRRRAAAPRPKAASVPRARTP